MMRYPTEATHVLGKLLTYGSEDNADLGNGLPVSPGSPQYQIQVLRSFRISHEFQDRYGYRTLGPTIAPTPELSRPSITKR